MKPRKGNLPFVCQKELNIIIFLIRRKLHIHRRKRQITKDRNGTDDVYQALVQIARLPVSLFSLTCL
jgi:hypothetical protein